MKSTQNIKVGYSRPFLFILFGLLALAFWACDAEQNSNNEDIRYDYYPNKTSLKYAKGFRVNYFKSYKVVELFNELDTSVVFQRYFLVEQGTNVPDMKEEDQLIRVPLASVSCLSTTQVSYLSVLGHANSISGVGYASDVKDSIIQDQLSQGWTMEITRSGELDKELVLESNTSTLMANAFDQMLTTSILELDIPVIYSIEYLESNVLARAEWIKFFALFFNNEKQAAKEFERIEKEYLATKEKLSKISEKPSVMFGSFYQGIWYVPGGKSLIPSLFSDAGANYIYSDQATVNNVHIDSESLMERMNRIDYWGFVLSKKLNADQSDFLAGDERMQELAKELNMEYFYCNSYHNDYFGMANLEPEVLLLDLGKIFHPDLFPQHQFVYFQPYK